jgi:ERCC4-related helicase
LESVKYRLADNVFTERSVEEALSEFFSKDGKAFMVSGYFHISGYRKLRDDIEDFLKRNSENQLIVIVGTEPDQFSATIAYDLWELEKKIGAGRIVLKKYEGSFLHTKHYLLVGEKPQIILGSANISAEGLTRNLELVMHYISEDENDPIVAMHKSWFEMLVKASTDVTEQDLEVYKSLRFPVLDSELFELLRELGVNPTVFMKKLKSPDPYPVYRLNLLSWLLDSEDTTKTTVAVKSRIKEMPHQIIAASKVYRNLSYNGFYLLADEVGLGKTFEAGIVLKQLLMTGKVKRVLIVVKASSMSDWKEVLQLFFEFPTVMSSSKKYDLKRNGFDDMSVWGYSDIIICSHHMFRSSIEDIQKHKWDMLILDEAHVVKNHQSLIHKLVKSFKVPYKLFLTATPVQNREREFFNIMDSLQPGFLGSWEVYRRNGIHALKDAVSGDVNYGVMTRFLRKDLPYIKIPPRSVKEYAAKLEKEELEIYDSLLIFLKDIIERNPGSGNIVSSIYQKVASSSLNALKTSMERLRKKYLGRAVTRVDSEDILKTTESRDFADELRDQEERTLEVDLDLLDDLLVKLRNLNIDTKLNSLVEVLEDLFQKEDRVVIFTQYTMTLEYLAEKLAKKFPEVPIHRYYGGLTIKERTDIRKKFETKGGIFLTSEAGAESINLQHANIMINYDLPWNPARLEQRIGRIQRIEQEREVLCFNFVVAGTIDHVVYERLIKKYSLLETRFGISEEIIGDQKLIDIIESGLLEEIPSISQLFAEALKERKTPSEIRKYFAERLKEREEYIEKLKVEMRKELKNFDKRIRVLLQGEQEDLGETRQKIEELKEEYRSRVVEFFKVLSELDDIEVKGIEGDVLLLEGDETILGEPFLQAALSGEASVVENLPLLSPRCDPLRSLVIKHKNEFSFCAVEHDSDAFIFDFLVSLETPISQRQTILRVKAGRSLTEVDMGFLRYPAQPRKVSVNRKEVLPRLVEALSRAYKLAKTKMNTQLDDELKKLRSFLDREKARLLREKNRVIEEEIRKRVEEPIRLNRERVERIKERISKNKATLEELRSARSVLREMEATKLVRIREISQKVEDEYLEKLRKVEESAKNYNLSFKLLSCLIL